MVHLFTLANVLVQMRYKNKRIFLSFCVFTTMSHVPTSMYKLLDNLANVSTIQILHVHEALFGTRLTQNPKTKKTTTCSHMLFPGPASATFPQFDTDSSHPKKQPHSRLPYISANPKRSIHVSQTQSVPAHVSRTVVSLVIRYDGETAGIEFLHRKEFSVL